MKFSIFALGLISSLAWSSPTQWSDSHVRGSAQKPVSERPKPLALTSGVFQQAIDHSGQLPGQTFTQRYWVDSEYATSDAAPVIYHICGEGDVDQSYFLTDAALQWAQELGARVVWLEHRYYGQSLPFTDLSTAHLAYLTLVNVLEDLATFQKWLSASQGWTGPWISVGGSYSGTLSALYRQAHPELVAGALASSAPMIAGVGQAVGTADDMDGLSSTDPSSDPGERQWVYQACTSLGFWLADGPGIKANLEYPSSWLCQQLFGNTPLVNAAAYNKANDQPFLSAAAGSPSNILFTYGSDDVWTKTGLYEQENANPNISILLINGAGHHFDLNAPDPSDSAAVTGARAQFTALVKHWL